MVRTSYIKKKWSLSVLSRNLITRFDWRAFEWGEDLKQRSSVGSSIRSGLNAARRNLWNPNNHQMSLVSRLNANFKIYFFSVLIALKHFLFITKIDACWLILMIVFMIGKFNLFGLLQNTYSLFLSVVWGKMKRSATYLKFFSQMMCQNLT
jgi:hypothetical protein